MAEQSAAWDETSSQTYRDLSDVAVPERERQIGIVAALVNAASAEGDMLDLCCGEGLLSRALLAAGKGRVLAYDGSPSMLATTRVNCGDDPRLVTQVIDIADAGWRRFDTPLRAAVSSLAVHHLDGEGKQCLFADLHAALASGGVFVLADVIRPVTPVGDEIAGRMWDEEVERRSLAIAGDNSRLETFRAAEWNHFQTGLDPIDKPSTLAEHFDWLRQAGFASVDLHWMLAGQMILSAWKD